MVAGRHRRCSFFFTHHSRTRSWWSMSFQDSKQLPWRKHVTHTRPGLPNPLEIWGRTDIPLGSGPGKGVVNDGSVWVTEPNEYLLLWKDGETITPKRGLGRLSRYGSNIHGSWTPRNGWDGYPIKKATTCEMFLSFFNTNS